MRCLNLGILAHVDAGKTSLTERLLYAAGAIDHVGSVDGGDTQTDSLALERARGITIKSAVVSFVIDDVTVNLIDTPGHPDFIAEVERVLSVLRRRGAGDLRRRGRAGADPHSDAGAAAIAHPNPVVRQQDRPERGRLRAGAGRHRREADPRLRAHGPRLRPRRAQRGVRPVRARRRAFRRGHGREAGRARRATDGGLRRGAWPRLLPASARRVGDPDPASAGPSGVLRLGDHRRRRRGADGRADHPAAVGARRRRGPGLGHGVQSGAGAFGREDRLRAPVPRHGAGSRPVGDGWERGAQGHGDQCVRARFGHAARRRRRGPDRQALGLGNVQIGDPDRLPRSLAEPHRFAPPTLETVVMPRRAGDRGLLHAASPSSPSRTR